jgi:hypothetical protein
MNDDSNRKSFWVTLPGIITAIAGLVTAVGACIAGLVAAGVIGGNGPTPSVPLKTPTPTTIPQLWLVIERLEFFSAKPGAQVRVVADINGTEYIYPSLEGVEWVEVGPSMSSQVFKLPPVPDQYIVRFGADVRVPASGSEPEILGKLTSVKEDIVNITSNLPYQGHYVLHTFDPVHSTRSANAEAQLIYRITPDPS